MSEPVVEKVDAEHRESDKHEGVDEVSWTPEEEKKLLRKIDAWFMPCMYIMYLMSYLDRTNIGNARLAGMGEDLELSSNEYSTALVVFFVTYVVFEAPSNMILVRWKPSLYLPTIMTIWGVLVCCMAAIKTYHHLVILRIFVGTFEAGFAPGILLIISSWYKKSEQSKRFAIYISAAVLSGAFGGLLAGAITDGLEGAHGIRGWRWLFIVEGVVTIGVAAGAVFILPDFPANTKRLTERERWIAIERLKSSNVVVRTDPAEVMGKRESFVAALKDWRIWPLIVGYMSIVGSATLSYFYPTLVNGLGYTDKIIAQYMTIPIYAVAFVCTLATGYFSDKAVHLRGYIVTGWLGVALVTAIVVCAVYNYTIRYAMLVIMAAGLWSANGLSLSYASSTLGDMPAEVRAIGLALVNCMGNLASIYGSFLFPTEDSPKYLMGFGVISALLGVGMAAYCGLNIVVSRRAGAAASQ